MEQYEVPSDASRYLSVSENYETGLFGEEEKPMFVKTKVDFSPQNKITHLAVSNDYMAIVMANGIMKKFNLKVTDESQDVDLNRIVPGVSISGVFLDPTGHHLLISFHTELLYQHRKFNKPKPVNKLKGQEVTAVGWNWSRRDPADNCSRPILIGTRRGLIFEVEISSDESLFTSSLENYCKQVFNLGASNSQSITGLQYHRVNNENMYFVIATTLQRIYQFVGYNNSVDDRPLLQVIFNKYLNTPEGFQEIPSSLKYSCLQLNSPAPFETPKTLGWLTETGIFHGQIDPKNTNTIFTKTGMLNFPAGPAPLGFVMTKFHVLLLYSTHVAGISILNEEVAFVDNYNAMFGDLVGIAKDAVSDKVWVFAERALFRYNITKEDRNVWQIYLDRGDYAQAKIHCQGNPTHLDQVYMKEADSLFNCKNYNESAVVYAKTQSSFEDIALKFFKESQNTALKIFLKEKLNSLNSGEKTERSMLILWILELLLTQLGDLRVYSRQNTDEYKSLQTELEDFLFDPFVREFSRSHKNAVYDLMARHGDLKNISLFALNNDDYERLIYDHIYKGEHVQALNILKGLKNPELWYNFASELLQALPKETISAIINRDCPLNPVRLLPALVSTETYHATELITYLEYCVFQLNCQEQTVHNYLIALCAERSPDHLTRYLAMQGKDRSMVNYDVAYALRVCQSHGHTNACVQLSSMLGLWDQAVKLALEVNVDLAREKAAYANDKKLWLQIAEHLVKNKNNISQAMKFVEQCESVKIEDILPFFPDFVAIDKFKEPICASLKEYNQHIQHLNQEIDEATISAEEIRSQLQELRTKHTSIQSTDLCTVCNTELMTKPMKPFYFFPCDHKFHSACLISELTPLLSNSETERLHYLQSQLAKSEPIVSKEKLREEIHTIVASQCLLCSDRMIETIKKPFIADEDYERICQEWL